ncbi:MAG: S-adenosylmethionine decarboxylase [Bdellovibrionales bacterium]|nr:S-adenosylmethionine decarboxylase [Bdellovibrionales bacterium]
MDTRAQHLLFDAVSERDLTESDIEHIKNVIENNLTVVERVEHKFTPHGETIVFILSESHFTLHTYPENRYITLDIYVCNLDINLKKIVDQISEKIPFTKVDQKVLQRGKVGSPGGSSKLHFIYFVTVITACCSILYELLLAQALSTTMGNTALRYNTTIGLYIAAMGFGALLYKKFVRFDVFSEFIRLELLLSIIGGVAPILALVFDYSFNKLSHASGMSFFSNWIQFPLFTANHLLIIGIGFLSGLELPLLIDMGKALDKKKGSFVLAYDYFGTLIGAILFPIVILPQLHIFTVGYVVSLMNLLVAGLVMVRLKVENSLYKTLIISMIIFWIFLLFNSTAVNDAIVKTFYFGGQL